MAINPRQALVQAANVVAAGKDPELGALAIDRTLDFYKQNLGTADVLTHAFADAGARDPGYLAQVIVQNYAEAVNDLTTAQFATHLSRDIGLGLSNAQCGSFASYLGGPQRTVGDVVRDYALFQNQMEREALQNVPENQRLKESDPAVQEAKRRVEVIQLAQSATYDTAILPDLRREVGARKKSKLVEILTAP